MKAHHIMVLVSIALLVGCGTKGGSADKTDRQRTTSSKEPVAVEATPAERASIIDQIKDEPADMKLSAANGAGNPYDILHLGQIDVSCGSFAYGFQVYGPRYLFALRAASVNMDDVNNRRQFMLDIAHYWQYSSGQPTGEKSVDFAARYCAGGGGVYYGIFATHVQ